MPPATITPRTGPIIAHILNGGLPSVAGSCTVAGAGVNGVVNEANGVDVNVYVGVGESTGVNIEVGAGVPVGVVI